MKFLHAADIHLDSPLRGLDRYEGAPVDEVRGATRRAFENLVRIALRERVDFVVIAGDLYDGDWPDFNTGLFFAKGMAQLGESGIAAYVVRGNHDAMSKLTRTLRMPANVHLFSEKAPTTQCDDNLGLAVHGQSFAMGPVFEDLAADYPAAVPGYFNLGLLHTALTGRPGHHPYAPTTEQTLRAKGYDYWALGHIHTQEIVARDPWIVFPGNTQGRFVREAGPKGCCLVTVEGGSVRVEPVALDVMRWGTLELDVSDAPDIDALLDHAAREMRAQLDMADGRVLGLRIILGGAGPLYATVSASPEALAAQLRALALDVSCGNVWLEKVKSRVRPPLNLEQLAQADDPVGLLIGELRRLSGDPASLVSLVRDVLRDIEQKLPADLLPEDALRLDISGSLQDVLEGAEGELITRLSHAAPAE